MYTVHPLYYVYRSMLKRCYTRTHKMFKYYGGRGICVCPRWRNSFKAFVADMGPRPDGYTIERIDNEGNYTPENCKWASRREQYRNRHGNIWVEFRGVRMIAADWSAETGVRADVILKRLKRGVPPEVAIFDTGNLHSRDASHMVRAAAAKKRAQTHCKRGHPLSGDNLHVYKAKNGWTARVCRACKRLAVAKSRSH